MPTTLGVVLTWLQYVHGKEYATLRAVDLAAFRWSMAILLEAIDKSPTLWNSMDYTLRAAVIRKLMDFVYHCIPPLFIISAASGLRIGVSQRERPRLGVSPSQIPAAY